VINMSPGGDGALRPDVPERHRRRVRARRQV